jgi:tetratricopeptide (TPR) repeat protein
MTTDSTINIFISYSHRDEQYLRTDSLMGFLKGLEQDNIEFWTDLQIKPGELWDQVIKNHIQTCDIALVLVSQGFLDSDYCQNVEIEYFLAGTEHLFPVILSPCDWRRHEWLASRQFLPGGDKTIEEHYRDEGDRKRLFLTIREQLLKRAQLIRRPGPDPELKPKPKPLRPDIKVTNLPPKPQWFMGYKAEKNKLKQHILTGKSLISITGAPRTGRRTLAMQVAHELLENGDLPGGAIWIDCQKIDDERALISAVSEVYLKSRVPDDLSRCQQILEDEFSKKQYLIVLKNTENPRADFFERWAKKVPPPSVVIDVTASFASPEGVPKIHLKGLDDKNAEDLFIAVASEARGQEKPFSKHAEFDRIGKICRETQNNPLLIELYAKKCDSLCLADILSVAHSERDADTLTIWKNQLEPLFSGLEEEHRVAFLKLCRLPNGVSRELVWEITGIKPLVLGPAIKKQFLWTLGFGRYEIDPSVRTFAETKLARPTIKVDGEVAAAFARVATAKAALIEQSLVIDRHSLDEAVEWFRAEWENLKYCVGVAECFGDKDTVCQIIDSILQFMIRRGKYEDCLTLYDKALSLRDKEDPGRAKTLNDMAVCLQFKGKFTEARNRIQESIKLKQDLIKKADDPVERCQLMFRLAQSWNTYGAINNLFGEELGDNRFDDAALDDSINAFKNAEQICAQALEIVANDSMRVDIEIERSQTLSNLGRVFTIYGHQCIYPEDKKLHFEEALKAFNNSIAIERPGDEREGQTYSRRGQLWLEKNKLPLAEMDFNEAIKIFDSASNTFELGLALLGRGRVFAKKDSPDIGNAINDFERAEELFAELHKWENQFRSLMESAMIQKKCGNLPKAIVYTTKAYGIADKAKLENEREEADRFLDHLQV